MIQIKNLTKIFNKGKSNACVAIDNIDLEIKEGECVAITGKSGSGKTTLLHILAGIENITSGSVIVDNLEISSLSDMALAKYRASKIGVVMQDFCLLEECSVIENVTMPLNFTKGKLKDKKEKATELIHGVELGHYIKKKVNELSGGEKQRVAIARALVAESQYMLCDEPTGSLDGKNSQNIIDMLLRINKKGKTIIIITHDKTIAKQCKRRIELDDGKIIKDEIL